MEGFYIWMSLIAIKDWVFLVKHERINLFQSITDSTKRQI